jgi:hypothetical protein
MENELVNLSKGEVDLDVAFKQGKLQLTVKYDGKGADASVTVALESEYFLSKLKAAIPGQVDDAVINLLLAAMKA